MSLKTMKIIGWMLTGLIVLVFIGSGTMKLIGPVQVVKGALALGITEPILNLLGAMEIIAVLLFAFPRTGLLGLLLLTAYLGGAIATHMEHSPSAMSPVIIECVLWITAAIRFPELSRRPMRNNTSTPITA